ncbi:MAG: spore coat protein H [Myxococcota bacterium]|jgi:spore coat protein H
MLVLYPFGAEAGGLLRYTGGDDSPGTSDWLHGTGTDTVSPETESSVVCVLEDDLSTPWYLEGETISFLVGCGEGVSASEVGLAAVRVPSGARLSADGAFVWETGPADGGRHDLVFAASTSLATRTVTVWVADNPDVDGAVAVDPEAYTEEWGLPVLHLTAPEGLGSSDEPGRVALDGDVYDVSVKVRGASSYYYPKKSYTLDFGDDEVIFPGWDQSRDHLILLTTFDDNSYVRQKLIYDLWAEMGEYWGEQRLVPRSSFAVVYLNGDYHGLYVVLDRIDDEFIRHMGFDDSGDLFKAVNHDANFYLTTSSGYPKSTLTEGYEKKEGEPEDSYASLQALVGFTGAGSASDLVEGAGDWIELGEFMDWLLLVHYSMSEDSAGKNSYLYQDPDTGLFRYVPWDFNHAWGQNWYTQRIPSDRLNYFEGTNRVFWAIQDVREEVLWDRFAELRDEGPLSPEALESLVDDYFARIQPSAERDWAVWREAYRSYSGWASARNSSDNWTEYEGEKEYLYQWLSDRATLFSDR